MGLFSKKKKTEETELSPAAEGSVPPPGKQADDELIAVIAAAVSAYEAEQFVQTLYIRKIARSAGTRPAWSLTGTNEAIDARRI